MQIARRSFSLLAPSAAAGALFGQTSSAPPAPPQIEATLVKDWIVKAHQRKLAPMKELLAREPHIIHSSWDWGLGDYESALQAAAHTGSREMALFLLDRGARIDLFAVTMLGQLRLLKNMLGAYPASLQVRGAHGITLLSHAVQGRDQARDILEYLLTRGVNVNDQFYNGMTSLMMAVQTSQRDTLKLLLAKGADPNLKGNDGATALSLSLKNGNRELAADLKAAGALE